mmetsp:Transcript_22252/g.33158  ORF Transcript_22252/g.33158 Transcript_22252/m.33158 type:complete len:141 (-) Transcript_22252:91-513(-)|eukprot:CAMPEP_0167757824 /NCGR_PEP_ID=MMETSP0110_2-20121227/10135_1 /TAXON_ID=629695 /ORGANISM="Gymnochlora sp., Strain CCMP2014" /LENGTH=140 /DNA_ID=CAMNT_0007644047 /DNA_START=103 /DNA_END=525 /DNA_ORIENTATION=-
MKTAFLVAISVFFSTFCSSTQPSVKFLPVMLNTPYSPRPGDNTNYEYLGRIPPGSSAFPLRYKPDQNARNLLKKIAEVPAPSEALDGLADLDDPGPNPPQIKLVSLVPMNPFGRNWSDPFGNENKELRGYPFGEYSVEPK